MSIEAKTRHDLFLAALLDSSIALPAAVTREEQYLAKIAGKDVPIPAEPETLYERYLAKLAGQDVTVPAPLPTYARLYFFLYKACGYDVEVPVPLTCEEIFWNEYTSSPPHEGEVVIRNGVAGETLTTCSVAFSLTQDGTGEASPENIRPVSGWEGVTIYRSGANAGDPTAYEVSWASAVGAVYIAGGIAAGTLNVLTGELTVTHNFITLDGTENWTYTSATNKYWYLDVIGGSTQVVKSDAAVCSHLMDNDQIKSSNAETGFRVFFSTQNKNRLLIRPNVDGLTDTDKFKAWLAVQAAAGTPVQVAYELLTPETYQLTAQDITLLDGVNRLWTDAGTLTATYTPDV